MSRKLYPMEIGRLQGFLIKQSQPKYTLENRPDRVRPGLYVALSYLATTEAKRRKAGGIVP